jgi:hypothetical protein
MATVGETVRTALVGNVGVTALVVGRIFPNVIPQGVSMPAIRYLVVDDVPMNVLAGNASRRSARVQIDAYAKKYLDAHAVADAVAGAVGTLSGPAVTAVVIDRRDGYEDETELHRVSMDVSVSMTT